MAYMRSTLSYILFWINLIIIAITLYITITEHIKIEKRRYYPDYLRTTMEKLQNIYPYYFLDEEFILSNHLRNLSFYPKPIMSALLGVIPSFALISLMISFCVTENECCTNNAKINENFPVGNCFGAFKCNCDCTYCEGRANCDCCQNGCSCILALSIFLFPFTIYFCILKACGKHVVRIFSIALLIASYIIMLVISFYYNYDTWPIILISIYSFGIVINFVGVLLPVCCKKLSYDYKSSNNIINRPISSNFKEIKNEQTSDDEQIYPNKDDIMEPINNNEDETPYYNKTNQGYDNNYGNNNNERGNKDFIQYPSSE